MSGPYQTERETYVEPMYLEVSELYEDGRVRSGDHVHLLRDAVLRHLVAGCEAAGVELGDYDMRILAWLARGETSAAQVVLDLIGRAHAAGQLSDSPSGTCQETQYALKLDGSLDAHLHECVRERGHRSPVHRCKCWAEWWPVLDSPSEEGRP